MLRCHVGDTKPRGVILVKRVSTGLETLTGFVFPGADSPLCDYSDLLLLYEEWRGEKVVGGGSEGRETGDGRAGGGEETRSRSPGNAVGLPARQSGEEKVRSNHRWRGGKREGRVTTFSS